LGENDLPDDGAMQAHGQLIADDSLLDQPVAP